MKRLVAVSAVLALVFCMAFAQGAPEVEQETSNYDYTMPTERVTLTVGVKEDIVVADWETNLMTKLIEEKFNVNLDFITFPSKEIGTKLNLMAMDGGKGMPDIILHAAKDNEISSWSSMGVIIPLTEYFEDDTLAANIQEAWDRIGFDYRGQVTSPDGEIYTIPSFNQSYGNEQPMKIWLYKPFLDALGLEVPTTTEELREVLKAVVNGDPNGNGKKDEIGISGTSIGLNFASSPSGWFEAIMNSFVYAGGDQFLTVENGKLGAAYTTEEWKEGLAYLRSLMAEGLLQDNILTQDNSSFKALINSEDPVIFMKVWYTAEGDIDKSRIARYSEYVGVTPFYGPEGKHYMTYRQTVASPRLLVSSNCKYPALAFAIGDYLSSEEMSIITRWGERGVDWDYVTDMADTSAYDGMYEKVGFDKYIVCYDDASFWSSGNPQNKSWRQQGPYVRQYAIANGQSNVKGSIKDYQYALAEYQYTLQNGDSKPEEIIPKLVYTDEENSQINEIKLTLKTYVDEYASQVIDGQKDLDATWAEFQSEIKKIGLDTYLSVSQNVYDRMYK
ncbi:MAG: extracellular solute-binding protein [Sphaerochaetaceae bacterium]|jgi:putative aldouronate transport system substrate-binding protein|nr:extracellular solute-binding protein [Sphaerochaetaceae bacterium]